MNSSEKFKPNCLPTLIGSFPIKDHAQAADLVFKQTPEIPLWVQLPAYPREGMVAQFAPGLPGLVEGDKIFLDSASDSFEEELLAYYEEYISVAEGGAPLEESRFKLTPEQAPGFFEFEKRIESDPQGLEAVKGQISGPFTLATSLTDEQGRAAFYDDRLRDCVVKMVALKAKWQVERLSRFNKPVIMFLDEPALAGFGSSAFISVTKEDVAAVFDECFEAIHAAGGLAGVHICANSDWSLVLDSPADIVSFDQFSVFDQFILFGGELKSFIEQGKIVAWGITPTFNADEIAAQTVDSLSSKWEDNVKQVEALGIDRDVILSQSLITPACGTGSLDFESACRVLELTRGVSNRINNKE